MKELRAALNKEFEGMSQTHFETFKNRLTDLEEKVTKGMNLSNIFNELKEVQKQFRDTKLTKEHRAKVWNKLDGLFKVVKEKKFGPEAAGNNSPSDRLNKRYDGLMNAIGRMEHSIERDRNDLKYEDRRIANSDGQLEAQIRQAKIKMIEERIRSKEEKLADMHRTREELEKKKVAQVEKDKRRAEQQKIKDAKEAAKAKIKEEMKAAESARKEQGEKLEKAADAIKSNTTVTKAEEVIGAVAEAAEEVTDHLRDTLEDAVDTVKAIAEVMGGKIHEKVQEAKEKIQESVEEVKEDVQAAIEKVEEKVVETAEVEEVVEEITPPKTVESNNVVASSEQKANLPDDLKIIEGIGPKIEEILQNVGIKSWEQLSKTPPTQLKSILIAAGSRYKSHNPGTWPKQAQMAAAGQWDELKVWQDELDGGVDRKAQKNSEEE